MATLDKWAEVLAVAAGPWKRQEMLEFATEVLESLLIDVTETTLRMVRKEMRDEISRSLASDINPTPLVQALARISRLSSEAVLTEAAQKAYPLPRRELETTPT